MAANPVPSAMVILSYSKLHLLSKAAEDVALLLEILPRIWNNPLFATFFLLQYQFSRKGNDSVFRMQAFSTG